MAQHTALARGSRILVTGANVFVDGNIINHLLQEGYNVRCIVRSEKPWLDDFFSQKYGNGRFKSMVIPTLMSMAFINDAMDGISGFVHVVCGCSRSNFQPGTNFRKLLMCL